MKDQEEERKKGRTVNDQEAERKKGRKVEN